jgi:hypothetical protein
MPTWSASAEPRRMESRRTQERGENQDRRGERLAPERHDHRAHAAAGRRREIRAGRPVHAVVPHPGRKNREQNRHEHATQGEDPCQHATPSPGPRPPAADHPSPLTLCGSVVTCTDVSRLPDMTDMRDGRNGDIGGDQQAAKRADSVAVRAAAACPVSSIGAPLTIVAGCHVLPVTPPRSTLTVRTPLFEPGPPLA